MNIYIIFFTCISLTISFESTFHQNINREEEHFQETMTTKNMNTYDLTNITKSRLVYKTEFIAEADKIVYITPYKHEASLIVYETKIKAEIADQKGIWYWTKFKQEADWKIYFTKHRHEANIILYSTKFKHEATSQ